MTFGFWFNNLPVEKTGMTVGEWLLRLFRPPAPPAPPPVSSPVAQPIDLFDAVNEVRQEFKRPLFLHLGQADMVGQLRAEGMRSRRGFGHEWYAQQVENRFPDQTTAECIAEGQATAREVVSSWMNEPVNKQGQRPHREAILDDYRYAGCGHAGQYWCLILVGPMSRTASRDLAPLEGM